MANPYAGKGPDHIWRPAIADRAFSSVEPISAKQFRLTTESTIATIGSCFAQNIARHLVASNRGGFLEVEAVAPDQPRFSALYGNVYTVRQLMQLFDRAFGDFTPAVTAWQRGDGKFVDCFRPFMFSEGFGSPEAVAIERDRHLAAVRRVFRGCSTLVFTMGLTEAWRSVADGAVFPVAPGVVAPGLQDPQTEFVNFSYDEIKTDLLAFVAKLKSVNPGANIILTVSPVPLTATYTAEHVLVATMASKSILRAVCGAVETTETNVFYFPSYEIITGHYNRGAYYEPNLRTVTEAGVQHVMRVFDLTYGGGGSQSSSEPGFMRKSPGVVSEKIDEVICDDSEIAKSIGF